MRCKPIVLVLAALAVVVSVAAAEESQIKIKGAAVTWEQLAVGDGEALYRELCAVCHGVDATGKGPAAPALKVPPIDLTVLMLDADVFPMDAVVKAITGESVIEAHGTDEMPIWGNVLRDVRPDLKPFRREAMARLSIYNIAKYLETLQVEEPD